MRRLTDHDLRAAHALGHGLRRVMDEIIARARVAPEDILREAAKRGLPAYGADAGTALASLRRWPVEALDPLARSYVSSNAMGAGVQGFVTNLGGLVALPIALPADAVGSLAWMVRATSGVMGAYGFETESDEGAAQLRVGLAIAAGVNRVTVEGTQVLVTTLSRRLAERQAAAHWAHYLRGPVSRTLADRMIAGRLPRLIPVVGGVVGAGMNVAMVRTVGGRARRHYRDLLMQWQRNQGVQPPALWYAG